MLFLLGLFEYIQQLNYQPHYDFTAVFLPTAINSIPKNKNVNSIKKLLRITSEYPKAFTSTNGYG